MSKALTILEKLGPYLVIAVGLLGFRYGVFSPPVPPTPIESAVQAWRKAEAPVFYRVEDRVRVGELKTIDAISEALDKAMEPGSAAVETATSDGLHQNATKDGTITNPAGAADVLHSVGKAFENAK